MGGEEKKRRFRSKISAKILLYFLVIALLPLIVVSLVLIGSARDQLLQGTVVKQQAVAADLAHRVDDHIANNTSLLAYTVRLYTADSKQTNQSLVALFKQSPDLQKVVILTTDGNKRTAAANGGGGVDISIGKTESDDTTLDTLSTTAKVLAVTRDDTNNLPHISLGLPILKNQELPDGTAPHSKADIIGGITATYDVGNSWKSTLSIKTSSGAYAYLVDNNGDLIYHPDQSYLLANVDLNNITAVRNLVNRNHPTSQNVSETGEDVVSTSTTTGTGWGVIIEEPSSSVYAGINFYLQLTTMVIVIAIIFSTFVIFVFRRQIVHPIKQLVTGARRLNQGEFTKQIDIRTKDEFQELAEVFNSMSGNINTLVSDLKTNNQSLTSEQSKLRSIINNVNDGVVAVNSKGEIMSVNPPAAKLVNQIPYALRGKQVTQEFPWLHDGSPFTFSLFESGIQSYTDITLAKGEAIAYLDLMVEVIDHDDTGIAAIITIHDQTASRELSFMKLDFVAIAAHELRTPLTVISGYLDMLNREAAKELSIFNLESLQKAIVGAGQLRELINKLLNIARIERGDMEIFIEKVNIGQLVSKNVEQHQPVAAQKEQTLTFTINTDRSIYVPADTASIVEVLNNLIGNALKYTPKNGQIQVNVIAGATEARIEVLDNGPGVPEDLREKLFTKFYRAERSLIAGSRGTGLGLFISRTIIDLQHGTIGIKPDGGPGSKFFFTLPNYDSARDDSLVAKNISGGIHGWFKKRPRN